MATATYKGYDDFVCDYNAARAAVIAEHGDNWHLVAGVSLWACLPRTWARCKVFGRTSSAPRDRRLPIARYWPSGELPVGPVYAELDTYREMVEIETPAYNYPPGYPPVEDVQPWHLQRKFNPIDTIGVEDEPDEDEIDPFAEALKRPPVEIEIEIEIEAPVAVEAPAVEAPKRRRGRPRKAEIYTVKRPPGRPRKVAVTPIIEVEEVEVKPVEIEIETPIIIPPPSFLQSAKAVLRGIFGRL